MGEEFKILLLGPAGSGKSTFISNLSAIDIFNYIAAETLGGANTTKVKTMYKFNKNCTTVDIVECITTDPEEREDIRSEMQDILKDEGIAGVFSKINDPQFAKKCSGITISMPGKKEMFPINSKVQTIIVEDSPGFGDLNNESKFNQDDFEVTDDVNAVLFFSISSIQQPAIFKNIIDSIMETNLKTPLLLLRRDEDLTHNDEEFSDKVLKNLENNDKDLKCVVDHMNENSNMDFRLNPVVFYIPEVKKWKGTIKFDEDRYKLECENYAKAVREVLTYSIEMYEKLYKTIVDKLNGDYQKEFVHCILNNLISDTAFEVVSDITRNPEVIPSKNNYYDISRDTIALADPPCLINPTIEEERPFINETCKNGNRYVDGVIPSYSYSCVNFRNVFNHIINYLVTDDNRNLRPLFNTFMSIVLEPCTVTTHTGYTSTIKQVSAFNFSLLTKAREEANKILKKNNLANDKGQWLAFTYKPFHRVYRQSEAVAVFVYRHLIELLNLEEHFENICVSMVNEQCIEYIEDNNQKEIEEKLSRK